jgi:hypothetical protein
VRRTLTIVLFAGAIAACSSPKPSSSELSSSVSSSASGSATAPSGTAPRFDVVLDDHGLTFPPGKTRAGAYVVSFEDRRSTPAGQRLHLQFLASGPRILLIDVAAGSSGAHALLANMVAEVVSLDPGEIPVPGEFLRPDALAHRHSIGDIAVTNPLSIEATPAYPTPVT